MFCSVLLNLRSWLVGCFVFNGFLRQYFSLYRAVFQRVGEKKREKQMREKMSKQLPPEPSALGRPGTVS